MANAFFHCEDYGDAAKTAGKAIEIITTNSNGMESPQPRLADLLQKAYMLRGISLMMDNVPSYDDSVEIAKTKLLNLSKSESSFEKGLSVIGEKVRFLEEKSQFQERIYKVKIMKNNVLKQISNSNLRMRPSDDSASNKEFSMSQISIERDFKHFRINTNKNGRKQNSKSKNNMERDNSRGGLKSPVSRHSHTLNKDRKEGKCSESSIKNRVEQQPQNNNAESASFNQNYIKKNFTIKRTTSRKDSSLKQDVMSVELRRRDSQNEEESGGRKHKSIKSQMDLGETVPNQPLSSSKVETFGKQNQNPSIPSKLMVDKAITVNTSSPIKQEQETALLVDKLAQLEKQRNELLRVDNQDNSHIEQASNMLRSFAAQVSSGQPIPAMQQPFNLRAPMQSNFNNPSNSPTANLASMNQFNPAAQPPQMQLSPVMDNYQLQRLLLEQQMMIQQQQNEIQKLQMIRLAPPQYSPQNIQRFNSEISYNTQSSMTFGTKRPRAGDLESGRHSHLYPPINEESHTEYMNQPMHKMENHDTSTEMRADYGSNNMMGMPKSIRTPSHSIRGYPHSGQLEEQSPDEEYPENVHWQRDRAHHEPLPEDEEEEQEIVPKSVIETTLRNYKCKDNSNKPPGRYCSDYLETSF